MNQTVITVVLFLVCAIPRVGLILVKYLGQEQTPVFAYANRSGSFWDPLPILFYQTTDFLLGPGTAAQAIGYALVASLIAPIVYLVARSLSLSRGQGVLAGLGAAFYPYYVSTSWFQPEVGITITLSAVCGLAFLRFMARPSRKNACLSGLTSGVLYLERADAVSLVFFMMILAMVRIAPERRKILLVAAGLVLAAAGSTLWNYQDGGRLSPLPAKGGYNLLLGHNAAVHGYLGGDRSQFIEYAVLDTAFAGLPDHVINHKQDPAHSRMLRERAFAFVRENPRITISNLFGKAGRFWDWRLEDSDGDPVSKRLAYTVPYILLVVLSLLGTWVLLVKGNRFVVVFLVGLLFAITIVAAVTIPLIRVRMLTEFYLIILGAVGLDWGWRRVSARPA